MTNKLSALAFAAAALTLLAGSAYAIPVQPVHGSILPRITQAGGSNAGINKVPPKQVSGGLLGQIAGTSGLVNKVPPKQVTGGLLGGGPGGILPPGVLCKIGSPCGPKPVPPTPPAPPKPPTMGGGDHDGDHDRDHDWHHRWYGGYYGGYGRPDVIVEGVPGPGMAPAPAAGVVEAAPARGPVAPQAAAEPCNCLTKQNLADGSVLFQDICTKESAIAAPQTVGSR